MSTCESFGAEAQHQSEHSPHLCPSVDPGGWETQKCSEFVTRDTQIFPPGLCRSIPAASAETISLLYSDPLARVNVEHRQSQQ